MSASREDLETEQANERTRGLDRLSIPEAFDLFQAEDEEVARAVARAKPAIVAAIELVASQLEGGGRLLYVGAGTSGRLGVLDAAECPPTFQSDPELVQGVLAGGAPALLSAVEGAEDSREAGSRAMEERRVTARDVVFGISAGGTTPFVHAALALARERGAATIFFACVPASAAPDEADVSIRVLTGPEVLAGSTRLKAGTATKMVLNRVSTLAMVRLGKVHENLMIDVDTRGNAKLRERGIGLVARITGASRPEAHAVLERAGGEVKTACLMALAGLDAAAARERLASASGHLRRALETWRR